MKSLIEIPKTMKALVLHEIGKLTLDEVPVEPLRPGTVLVKIKAFGRGARVYQRNLSFPDNSGT